MRLRDGAGLCEMRLLMPFCVNCVALLRLVLIGGADVDALRGKTGRGCLFCLPCELEMKRRNATQFN